MRYTIDKLEKLKRILWWDFTLGFVAGMAGLFLFRIIAELCGLPEIIILFISAVTLMYSIFAFYLASQETPWAIHVRYLVQANWIWTVISLVLLAFHYFEATFLGSIFILGQIAIVGGLAYLEGKQLRKI